MHEIIEDINENERVLLWHGFLNHLTSHFVSNFINDMTLSVGLKSLYVNAFYGSTNEIIIYRVPLVTVNPSWKCVNRPGCINIQPSSVDTMEQLYL